MTPRGLRVLDAMVFPIVDRAHPVAAELPGAEPSVRIVCACLPALGQ